MLPSQSGSHADPPHETERLKERGASRWDEAAIPATSNDVDAEETAQSVKVFCALHNALRVAIDGEPQFGYAIRESFEVLQKQASTSSKASEHATRTLLTMVENNPRLKEWLPKACLEFIMAEIDRDLIMRAHNVSLLAAVVACGNRGIRKNQDFVVRKWLLDKKRASLIIDTRSPDSGIVQVRIKDGDESGSKHRYVDVESFCATSLVHGSKDRHLFEHYKATLLLLTALCHDNDEARHLVGGPKRHVTFHSLRMCMTNERIPADLRTSFANLIRVCYVDRPVVDYVNTLQTTFIFSEIGVKRGFEDDDVWHVIAGDLPGPLFEPHPDCEGFAGLKKDCMGMLTNHAVAVVPEPEPGANQVSPKPQTLNSRC